MTLHARSMTSLRDTLNSFTDAAAVSVARAIATVQRDAERERELREAQFAARMTELDARIAAVGEVERTIKERLASLKDGEPGRDGADGLPGANGENGRDGVNGKDGEPGRDGVSLTLDDVKPMIEALVADAVAAIPSPADGKDGRDGRDGIDGERGPAGAPGKLPRVRFWQDDVHYEGEVVVFNGRTYQAVRDTGKAPGHEDWICIAERGVDGQNGQDGADGRSFVIRGTWLEINQYRMLDVVALNGASFVAKRDDPGPCPGEGWQLMAAQGKRGQMGEGKKGDTGVRGLPGEPIVSMSVDDDGVLTLTNGDGSQVTCDLYPLLNRR